MHRYLLERGIVVANVSSTVPHLRVLDCSEASYSALHLFAFGKRTMATVPTAARLPPHQHDPMHMSDASYWNCLHRACRSKGRERRAVAPSSLTLPYPAGGAVGRGNNRPHRSGKGNIAGTLHHGVVDPFSRCVYACCWYPIATPLPGAILLHATSMHRQHCR